MVILEQVRRDSQLDTELILVNTSWLALRWRPAGGWWWHWHWHTMYYCYDHQMQFHIMFILKTQLLAPSGPFVRLQNSVKNFQLTTLELSRGFMFWIRVTYVGQPASGCPCSNRLLDSPAKWLGLARALVVDLYTLKEKEKKILLYSFKRCPTLKTGFE